MKIQPKPIRLVHRPETPALKAVVKASIAPLEQRTAVAYHQLVTGQGLSADRAKRVLGLV